MWTLVPSLRDIIVIGTKWIFKKKIDDKVNIIINKTKFVAQGYTHVKGIDFDETFALVALLESIRLLLIVVCCMGFKFYQMDVKSLFLDGVMN